MRTEKKKPVSCNSSLHLKRERGKKSTVRDFFTTKSFGYFVVVASAGFPKPSDCIFTLSFSLSFSFSPGFLLHPSNHLSLSISIYHLSNPFIPFVPVSSWFYVALSVCIGYHLCVLVVSVFLPHVQSLP